jgi:hypothetical protein
MFLKYGDLVVDPHLMEKRLVVHCAWWEEASLVTLVPESFEKILPNPDRLDEVFGGNT